jgi:hypothetical protein
MSVQHPSRTARRLIQLASLSLAGLIAGLLTGCSSESTPGDLSSRNDTGWQTSQTYAAATADLSPARITHGSTHLRIASSSHAAQSASGHHHAMSAYPSL